MTTAQNLFTLFNPKSIAIIGASRDPEKIGNIVIKNLQNSNYKGKIFPVNREARKILGLTAYNDILDIKEKPDLVVISIPALYVLDEVKKAARANLKNFVIFSAGFKEIPEGVALENQLKEIAKDYSLSVVGPNCLGFYNASAKANITFGKVPSFFGNLRFVSQSGALATAMFDWAEHHSLGFSDFITLGNKAVLNENDILDYFLYSQDPSNPSPVGMYLESIANGKVFLEKLRRLTKTTPVMILKPGKSKGAQVAMQSHTGSIAGADDILDLALKDAGAIRVSGFQEMFDLSRAFVQSLPSGPNLAIVSNAGGPAVVSSDLVEEYGLSLAKLSADCQKTLLKFLPRHAGTKNPVDVLGDARTDRYTYATQVVLKEKSVDSVLVILTPQMTTEIEKTSQTIAKLSRDYQKTIIACFIGGEQTGDWLLKLSNAGVPCYNYPERAIKVISNLYKANLAKNLNHTHQINISPLTSNFLQPGLVSPEISKKLLSQFNIKTPKQVIIKNIHDLSSLPMKIKYPLVLKASGQNLVHKTEHQAVFLGIQNLTELKKAYHHLRKLQVKFSATQIFAQEQISSGIEAIVGIKTDPTFGGVALFGLGGKLVELISDKNLCLLPLNHKKIKTTLEKSKLNKILSGYRNSASYSTSSLIKLIQNLSNLYLHHPEIQDIEINPVIVTKNQAFAVDARIIVHGN